MNGIGSHQSAAAETTTWLTPPEIIKALGPFDLDPCTPETMPWETAAARFTEQEDGLLQPWHGRVWLNPPYGSETGRWLAKLLRHGNGIALVFARTETAFWFDTIWRKADAVLFIEGRLHFHHGDGRRAKANSGAPSALVAYGSVNADQLERCGIAGMFIRLRSGGLASQQVFAFDDPREPTE